MVFLFFYPLKNALEWWSRVELTHPKCRQSERMEEKQSARLRPRPDKKTLITVVTVLGMSLFPPAKEMGSQTKRLSEKCQSLVTRMLGRQGESFGRYRWDYVWQCILSVMLIWALLVQTLKEFRNSLSALYGIHCIPLTWMKQNNSSSVFGRKSLFTQAASAGEVWLRKKFLAYFTWGWSKEWWMVSRRNPALKEPPAGGHRPLKREKEEARSITTWKSLFRRERILTASILSVWNFRTNGNSVKFLNLTHWHNVKISSSPC